jgi:hypothetical protein
VPVEDYLQAEEKVGRGGFGEAAISVLAVFLPETKISNFSYKMKTDECTGLAKRGRLFCRKRDNFYLPGWSDPAKQGVGKKRGTAFAGNPMSSEIIRQL